MKIEIKKCKITKTIFNQIVKHNLFNKDFEVLGWCNSNDKMFIVFYNNKTKQLSKLERFFKIRMKEDFIQIDNHGNRKKHFFVEVENITYDFKENNQEQIKFNEYLKSIILDVQLKGQFYL